MGRKDDNLHHVVSSARRRVTFAEVAVGAMFCGLANAKLLFQGLSPLLNAQPQGLLYIHDINAAQT